LLDLPAILLSIPNLPVKARPQAGLSFAPWTFEIYFGYGESRFLSAFYGEEPQVMPVAPARFAPTLSCPEQLC
jgi:hypothetical protein